ncbi:MAG: histidine phosphatase family protein [Acidobacteriota bacterium]
MKNLLLLRHAKSSWKKPNLSDFDRPLNERGQKAAQIVGRFLRKQEFEVDLVISSPAVRARQTIERVLSSAKWTPEVRFDQRIYEASPTTLLEVVSQIDEDRKSVLLVGHNPGMEELLTLLVGKEEPMPTAALAKISISIKRWDKIEGSKAALDSLWRVKELKPHS